jgi:hypothetical protein
LHLNKSNNNHSSTNTNNDHTISNELLNAAQNNIYDEDNYKTEIKQDNNFYGIQGLNTNNIHYIAFDNDFNNYSNL